MKRLFRILLPLLILALLAHIAYPYISLWRLDRALIQNDVATETALIDLATIQAQVRVSVKKETDRMIGKGDDDVTYFFREGAKALTKRAVTRLVDHGWVRTRLRRDGQPGNHQPFPSLLNHVSYAFFESWDRFNVRLGDLGDDPVYVQWQFQDWQWRVTAIYD